MKWLDALDVSLKLFTWIFYYRLYYKNQVINLVSEIKFQGLESLVTVVDTQQLQMFSYGRHFAGCFIKTHDGRLLLQQRGVHWDRFPGMLATFGGQVDSGETPLQGMVRELREELGAEIDPSELLFLGAFTKLGLNDALIHAYWWDDRKGSISGCYEGDPVYFDSATDVLSQDNITPDVYWIAHRCLELGLLSSPHNKGVVV